MKRKAMEVSPLDPVVLDSGNSDEPAASPRPEIEAMTFKISAETANRIRNAVYWERLTMTELADRILREGLDRLEKKRGEVYPQRPRALSAGRPVRK